MIGLILWVVGLAFIAAGAVTFYSAGTFSAAQQQAMGKSGFGRFVIGLNEGFAREQKQSQGPKHLSQLRTMGAIVVAVGVVVILVQLTGGLES